MTSRLSQWPAANKDHLHFFVILCDFELSYFSKTLHFYSSMVNEKGERSSEDSKSKNKETGEETVEKLSKSSKDFNTMTRVQERLKTLEARIKAVKSDFKTQVEGLRSRMEHLKTDLKTVHCDIDMNPKKIENSDEASEIL